MRRIEREEIVDLETYERRRPAVQKRILAEKALRRVHLGEYLTFLFENAETVCYQVQEMLRIERRSSEADVQHELDTYNELLGDEGELGCTLMIEIEDEAERARLLPQWLDLPRHVYMRLAGGAQVRPRFDERQIGRGRLSSVQYLLFPCGSSLVAPIGIGCDLPGLELEVDLTEEQRAALSLDLGLGAAR